MLTQAVGAAQQAVLTVFYFFYFLFKGKPEWQCERAKQKERLLIKNCCVDCRPDCDGHQQPTPTVSQSNGYGSDTVSPRGFNADYSKPTPYFSQGQHGQGWWSKTKCWLSNAWTSVKRVASNSGHYIKKGLKWTWSLLCTCGSWLYQQLTSIWPWIKTIFLSSAPSQTLPPPSNYPMGTYRPINFDDSYENEKSLSSEPDFKDIPQHASRLPPIPPPRPTTPATPTVKLTPAEAIEEESYTFDKDQNVRSETESISKKDNYPTETVANWQPDNYEEKQEESRREETKTPVHQTYIQEPNIDLSQYTTRIGGVGPTVNREKRETTMEEVDSVDRRTHREKSVGPPIEGGFYAQRTFTPTIDREGSVPPPPPPPPPAKPVRMASELDKENSVIKSSINQNSSAPKGAIPMLPVTVLEQMSAGGNDFGERTERGRSATVTERVREANSKTPVNFETRSKTPVNYEPRSKTPVSFEPRAKTPVSFERNDRKTPLPFEPRQESYTLPRPLSRAGGREGSVPPQGWRPVSAFEMEPSDRSQTTTPWRATSVGPSVYTNNNEYRQNVVSRIDNSSSEEPQFIFRGRIPPFNQNMGNDGYLMGRSVYTPIPEADDMRRNVNRRSMSVSRPVTPAHSMASRTTTPFEQTTNYNSDDGLRRRSRTVGPQTRESTVFSDVSNRSSNGVNNRIRGWPPVSNATPMDLIKDNWLNGLSDSYVSDDGLTTTKIKRIAEKKVEDNWKWRDDRGRLLDERTEHSWRGDLDQLEREGQGKGRQFSRTVEILPTGDTRFQDVNRQYNNNFVVESICRNY